MRNEKGVIFPLTMIISFFMFLLFSHQIALYLNEKKFLIEVEGINQLESIMQMGVKDISAELLMLEEVHDPILATLIYPNGSLDYSINPDVNDTVKVIMTAMDEDGRKYIANMYFSFGQKKVIKWIEVR